ncbi:hypothetical protein U1707_13015 [Sphingomonas sp. PB2P12]|uniref:hypothetical protein n=1 Tax=Sphingomonas sandaracina TaxID=3096157 RepID=UPI002FC9CA88
MASIASDSMVRSADASSLTNLGQIAAATHICIPITASAKYEVDVDHGYPQENTQFVLKRENR